MKFGLFGGAQADKRPGWCSVRSSMQIHPRSAGAFGAALLFVAVASVARWGVGLLDPESAPMLLYSKHFQPANSSRRQSGFPRSLCPIREPLIVVVEYPLWT
jgi:hypothetical protein